MRKALVPFLFSKKNQSQKFVVVRIFTEMQNKKGKIYCFTLVAECLFINISDREVFFS